MTEPCPRGWSESEIHPGLRDGPCGYIGCCTRPGPADAEARAHMRRAPGHELTVGSDDAWHCLTCESEEER